MKEINSLTSKVKCKFENIKKLKNLSQKFASDHSVFLKEICIFFDLKNKVLKNLKPNKVLKLYQYKQFNKIKKLTV